MKAIIYSFIIAMVALMPTVANATAPNSPKTPPTVAIETPSDTVKITVSSMLSDSIMSIIKEVKSAMNDTVIRSKNADSPDLRQMSFKAELENDVIGLVSVSLGIIMPFLTVIIVVLIVLVVSYKKRKAKYQLIQKAIDAGIVLPEYMFNEGVSPKNPEQGTSNSGGTLNSLSPYQWMSIKSGITYTAVGLGLILFFLIAGATPVAAICSIVFFIGIGKIIMVLMQRKMMTNQGSSYSQQPQNPVTPPPFPKDNNNSDPK